MAPRPEATEALKIACPAGAPVEAFQRYGGPRLIVETLAVDVRPETAATADIWVFRPVDLPRLADAGLLAPLPATLTDRGSPYGWADVLPAYSDRLLKWKGRPYALPLLGDSPLCFYRADLFADASHRAAFRQERNRDLAAPATWDDFAQIAAFFARRLNKPALPPLGDDATLVSHFDAIAASTAVRAVRLADRGNSTDEERFSFHHDLVKGESRIARAGFVEALRLLQRLQPLRGSATTRPPPQTFAEGHAVLCLADASWIARFQKAKIAFGVGRVPGSRTVFEDATGRPREVAGINYVPYLGGGGWLVGVPKASANADAAFARLADITGEERSRQIVFDRDLGGGPTRGKHLDPRGWTVFDLDPAQTGTLVEALRQTVQYSGLSNAASVLRLPDADAYHRALAGDLRAALAEPTDPAAALKKVEGQWQALDAKKGAKKARADYAVGVGLPPPE